MQVKTLLNYSTKFKGFVFQTPKLDKKREALIVEVLPRKNSKGCCRICGEASPTYDHLKKKREFLLPPLWSVQVILLYSMRRVSCQDCGKVVVEKTPWDTGKSPVTRKFAAVLAFWARKLS